jgi:hypothetical protein
MPTFNPEDWSQIFILIEFIIDFHRTTAYFTLFLSYNCINIGYVLFLCLTIKYTILKYVQIQGS